MALERIQIFFVWAAAATYPPLARPSDDVYRDILLDIYGEGY